MTPKFPVIVSDGTTTTDLRRVVVAQVDANGEVDLSSVPASVDWGDIEGTLSDQTDLQGALDEKVDLAAGKTAIVNNSITFAGTDSTTMTFPPTSASVGYLNIPQQAFSAAYPIVAADSGKHLYHPASDANARQVTIPANASVPFALGTAITIINDSANDVTVIITDDVLTYANVGTITTLTIPQYNQATIIKVLAAQWNASGTAGCTTA